MPWTGIIDFSVWTVLTGGDYDDIFNYFFTLVGVFGFISFSLGMLFKIVSRS